jgi:hypothetical protein
MWPSGKDDMSLKLPTDHKIGLGTLGSNSLKKLGSENRTIEKFGG